MMKIFISIVISLFIIVTGAQAQTVSVGNKNNQSVNLSSSFTNLRALVSALSAKINTTNSNLTTVSADLATTTAKLSQVTVCNDKGMIYDPNGAGADGDGCVSSGGISGTLYQCPVSGNYTLSNCTGQITSSNYCWAWFISLGSWVKKTCTPL